MDIFSNLINFIDVGLVIGIIGVIQFVKKFVESAGFKVSANVWKLVVIGMGIVGSLIAIWNSGWDNFTWASFIRSAFIYMSASTFIYQTGKLGITKVSSLTGNSEDSSDGEVSEGN